MSSTDGFQFVFIKVEVAFCGSRVTRALTNCDCLCDGLLKFKGLR